MTNTPTPEQIADKLEELAKRWPEATMLREAAALIRRPSIRPDGEMVERAAIHLCALDLGNEGFWKTIGEEDRNAYRDEARDVLTAALAAMPGGVDERKNTLLKVATWHEEQAKFFREHCARRAWEGYSGKAASAERKAMVHETCAEHFRQMAEAPTPPAAQEGK